MDGENGELSGKRKFDDVHAALGLVKKCKPNSNDGGKILGGVSSFEGRLQDKVPSVEGTLQNGEAETRIREVPGGEGIGAVEVKLEAEINYAQSEEEIDPFQSANQIGELSDGGISDTDGDHETDSEDSGEEDLKINGEEEEMALAEDGDSDMVLGYEGGLQNVETCLDIEDDQEIYNEDQENTGYAESSETLLPYDTSDLQCKNCFKIFARKSYLRGHSCSKDLQINNKALECKFCHKRYSHKINLRLHLKLHNNPKQFQCHVCLKYLSSSSSLRVHVKTHFNQKAFKCPECDTAFNQKVHLNDHILSHHTNMRPYNCHLCNKTYVSKSVLKKHLKKHLGLYKYACEICSKRFYERSSLTKHLRTHTPNFPLNKLKSDEPLQCHACLTYFHFKYKLITHQMLEHGLGKENDMCYQCPLCDIKFNVSSEEADGQSGKEGKSETVVKQEKTETSESVDGKGQVVNDSNEVVSIKQEKQELDEDKEELDSNGEEKTARSTNNLVEPTYPTHLNDHKSIFSKLKITPTNLHTIISEHIKSHEYVENHMCELCYKVFETRENLIRHLKIHDGYESKRFKCEQCDKRFSTNADLYKHSSAIHQRLRLHECDLCGKNFSQRNNLKRHLDEVHRSDGLKFECYVCSKVLATSHSLKRHVLIHNGPKYTCDKCGREFTRVYELNVHKKLHEDESVPGQLKCEFCGKVFLKRSNLKAHIDNNHLDYSCLECKAVGEDVSFDVKKNLLLHLKTQHKNVISNVYLTCLICFKTFINDTDLGRHMKMHSDDNQIQCKFCDKYFSRNYNLKMHMKTCNKNASNGILTCDDDVLTNGRDANDSPDEVVMKINRQDATESPVNFSPVENGTVSQDSNEENGTVSQGSFEEEEDDSENDMLVPEVKMEIEDEMEIKEEAWDSEDKQENFVPAPNYTAKRETDPLSMEDIINAGEVSITRIPAPRPVTAVNTNAAAPNQNPNQNSLNASLKIIQCHICLKTFAKKDSLKKHMRVFHTYISPDVIKAAPGIEGKPNILEVILQEGKQENSPVIQCRICSKTFTRKDSLRKHMRRFHIIADEKVKSEFSEGQINRNMLEVILKESGHEIKSRIPCDLCYKTFTRKDSLRKHVKIFHTRRSVNTVLKPEDADSNANPTEASDSSNSAKTSDSVNPAKTSDPSKTETHPDLPQPPETAATPVLGVATPNDRIPCVLCDKSFTRKDSLKKHMRLFHTQNQDAEDPAIIGPRGERTFLNNLLANSAYVDSIRCELCDKSFTRKDSLKKHNRIFHGGADPQVLDARMATGSAEFLEVVLDENASERPALGAASNDIQCRICDRKFTRNYNLKKHMSNVHKMGESDGPYFGYEFEPEGEDEGEEFGSLSNSMLEVIIQE